MRLAAMIMFFLAASTTAFSTDIFVPDDYATIQAAINAAANGDTVIVRPGTYQENLSIGKAITVKSESGPAGTIIDGGGAGSVVFFNAVGTDTILEAFSITNGVGSADGGGIYCSHSSPTIKHNSIYANSGTRGGGICCYSGSSPVIEHNKIYENNAVDFGGGIDCYSSSSPTIRYNEIYANNVGRAAGGGIYANVSSNPVVMFNAIYENKALGQYGDGAGICINSEGTTVLNNNTFWNNQASGHGGALYFGSGSGITRIFNTISMGNQAPQGHEFAVVGPITLEVSYSDVGGGESQVYLDLGAILDWDTVSNMNVDPLFVDPDNGNFHLQPNSPCIDAGDPNSPPDPVGTRADMGAYYFDQTPLPDLEFTSISFSPEALDPGDQVTIDYTVENKGQAFAATPDIGFYLSEDSVIETTDILIAEVSLPDMNPGDTQSGSLPVTVNQAAGNWFLGGYADHNQAIAESNEDNGYCAGELVINSLWADVTTISRQNGGVVTFDIDPGVEYERRIYFLHGCYSGTSPGVVLPGGNILPLNPDLLYHFINSHWNYPLFAQFRGFLDIHGAGTAYFAPGPLVIPPFLVGKTLYFAFTTEYPYDFQSNPVEVGVGP